MRMYCGRKLSRPAGVTHALEAAVGGGIRPPAGHSRDVKLAVLGVEPPAVPPERNSPGKGTTAPWGWPSTFSRRTRKCAAHAEGEMQELTLKRAERPSAGTVT